MEALYNEIGQKSGHYEANRTLSLLHKMFVMASKIGYTGANPATGSIGLARKVERGSYIPTNCRSLSGAGVATD